MLLEIYTISIVSIVFLITFLLLHKIGFTSYIHEELYTNPIISKVVKITGGVLYMVGGSLLAAVVYTYLTNDEFELFTVIVSVVFITYGEILKEV